MCGGWRCRGWLLSGLDGVTLPEVENEERESADIESAGFS
jgi:hypothetical protein